MSYGPKPNCPWRKPPKHPLDDAQKIAHVIGGMMFGALASLGFVALTFFMVMVHERGSLWIPGGILIGSTLLCGILGGFSATGSSTGWRKNGRSFFRVLPTIHPVTDRIRPYLTRVVPTEAPQTR